MQLNSFSPTVFIVSGDPGVSQSTQALLETHDCCVKTISRAEDFNTDRSVHESDIILLNLDQNGPEEFKLLNTLMFSDKRPTIFLMTNTKSALHSNYVFPRKNIKILRNPVFPADLISEIEAIIGSN